MANYKRKGHRGRGKQNVMDNQACRVQGNSLSKQAYHSTRRPNYFHRSKSQRNQLALDALD
jgi:hypothetical protein